MDDQDAIVIDCGSSSLQAGIAGDDSPSSVFPSCIGTPKYPSSAMIDSNQKLGYIGESELSSNSGRRGILNFSYPIENGIVKNWDLMDILLEFTFFKELKLDEEKLKSHTVLFAEPVLQPRSNSEKLLEYSFEKYQVHGVYCAPQPILSVYASGRGSAMSMCLGEGVIQIMPVYEGFTCPESMRRLNFGGANITDHMIHLLRESQQGMDFTNNRLLVQDMIQQVGYVALNYEEEMESMQQQQCCSDEQLNAISYELPDGQVLSLGSERFSCSEILFNPAMVNREMSGGIADLLHESIQATDVDNRQILYANLIVTGGPSMFPGLSDRMTREMTARAPHSVKVKVVDNPERKYSVWIGGSILATMSSFQHKWITKEEYEDAGPSIVHRKCFLY